MTLIEISKSKKPSGKFWGQTFFGFLIFVFLTVLPLVLFDFRHGFLNSQAFINFVTGNQQSVVFQISQFLPRVWDLNREIFTRLVGGKNTYWGFWIALIMSLMVVLKIIRETFLANWHRFITRNPGLFLLLVWFLVGLGGLSLYQQNVYDHYFGFLFPIPFLFVGWFLAMIWHGKTTGKILTLILLGFLVFLAVKESPLRYPPNRQLQRTQAIAQFVLEKAQNQPFNLGLIAERNYDEAYAFFMEKWNKPPVRIDPQQPQTITPQLFVICEQNGCQPIYNPKAEIAMFGWSKIDQKWEVEGLEVYQLSHFEH
jgi:hypothetical protein